MVDQGTGVALQTAWVSRDLASPVTPAVLNGVVFAVAGGAAQKKPAVLYALDGSNGKELWSSGTAITAYVTSGGISAMDGQIYLGTYDNTLYAFGIAMEK